MQDSAAAPLLTPTASALISARGTTTLLRRNSTEPILHFPEGDEGEGGAALQSLPPGIRDIWLVTSRLPVFSSPHHHFCHLRSGTFLMMFILRANWRDFYLIFFCKTTTWKPRTYFILIGWSICASDTWPTVHVFLNTGEKGRKQIKTKSVTDRSSFLGWLALSFSVPQQSTSFVFCFMTVDAFMNS